MPEVFEPIFNFFYTYTIVHTFFKIYFIIFPFSEHCAMKGIIHGEADETTTSEERENIAEKSTTAGSEIHISKL